VVVFNVVIFNVKVELWVKETIVGGIVDNLCGKTPVIVLAVDVIAVLVRVLNLCGK